ncbi:hypothetical protein [Streptomyces sp. NPDC089799]|uniref:hypothetical protein n=1 Tax=Streptomyces sp. NPDC089799 TaxID=3155066 RepID=UPI00342299EC
MSGQRPGSSRRSDLRSGRPGSQRSSRRQFLRLLGGSLLLPAAVAGAAGCTAASDRQPPDHLRVRTDAEPIRTRLGALGALSDPHWLGYDIDDSRAGGRSGSSGTSERTVPGPDSRIRLVGLARLPKETVAATLATDPGTFEPAAPPEVPEPLAPYVPDAVAAAWRSSPAYDARVLPSPPGGTANPAADGRFFLSEPLGLVWFDTVFLYT